MAIGWQVPANWWTRDHNLCIATSWITVARALGVDYRKVETQGPVKVIILSDHFSRTESVQRKNWWELRGVLVVIGRGTSLTPPRKLSPGQWNLCRGSRHLRRLIVGSSVCSASRQTRTTLSQVAALSSTAAQRTRFA